MSKPTKKMRTAPAAARPSLAASPKPPTRRNGHPAKAHKSKVGFEAFDVDDVIVLDPDHDPAALAAVDVDDDFDFGPDDHTLVQEEAAQPGETGADDQIDDPIRMYLMQMGEIPMLSRAEEIASKGMGMWPSAVVDREFPPAPIHGGKAANYKGVARQVKDLKRNPR